MLTLTSPRETWLHAIPAGHKLAVLCAATMLLFQLKEPLLLAGALTLVCSACLCFGQRLFRQGITMLRPLIPFVIVILTWHGWTGDVEGGLVVTFRLLAGIAIANLFTMTTRLSDIIGVIEWMATPLHRIGLDPRALAMSIALSIRFIPVLRNKLEVVGSAWNARSPRRRSAKILVPIALAALDDAEHVADALRARGGVTSPNSLPGG